MFVLEDFERAQARGAPIYLEIGGYARQRDQSPDDPGSGLVDSMKLALANAARMTDDIDYISAYGPGHPALDSAEVRYIKEVFGERAYSIPISSIKGVTGNPLSAGGPLQIATCALSFRDQMIPPTANYEVQDPLCDLDYVPHKARQFTGTNSLVIASGFSGIHTSLALQKAERYA